MRTYLRGLYETARIESYVGTWNTTAKTNHCKQEKMHALPQQKQGFARSCTELNLHRIYQHNSATHLVDSVLCHTAHECKTFRAFLQIYILLFYLVTATPFFGCMYGTRDMYRTQNDERASQMAVKREGERDGRMIQAWGRTTTWTLPTRRKSQPERARERRKKRRDGDIRRTHAETQAQRRPCAGVR